MNERTSKRQVLLFTDLDGTLLDHESYDWSAAVPALKLAQQCGVPVIPCTSKTYTECLKLSERLDLNGPFIFENGAGIALPVAAFPPPAAPQVELDGDYWLYSLGTTYRTIRQTLGMLRKASHYQFRGIGDMSTDQVCQATGLCEEEAGLAKLRRHSEPLLWLGDAKSFDRFIKEIKRAGLRTTRGGRFIHVMGQYDKGQAMLWLASLYRNQYKLTPFMIALGDSNNDLPMLQRADAAVVVRRPHRTALELEPQSPDQIVITTDLIGPNGWNQAVLTLLNAEKTHG